MGLIGTAIGIGKKVIGAGRAASDADSQPQSSDSNKSGTPLLDKITKWNDKRKQKMDAQKSAGANDLTGIVADPATGAMSSSAKKGGTVKREGIITVHVGERVLTKAEAKKYEADKQKPKKTAPKKTAKKAGPRKRA